MKAIVLTYDKYRTLTERMISMYQKLWPGHPYRFRIPYQELPGMASSKREYLKTVSDI